MNVRHWLRWIFGLGYEADYFDRLYSHGDDDVWGYSQSSFHKKRFFLIMRAIPKVTIINALEIGCAEGHLTRCLSERVERVIACDISEEAIQRAKINCKGIQNIQFRTLDIRKESPDELFDLLVYSDVFYYFSKREIDRQLTISVKLLKKGGYLVFANEWNSHYRGLTSPEYVLQRLRQASDWALISIDRYVDELSSNSLVIAVVSRL